MREGGEGEGGGRGVFKEDVPYWASFEYILLGL